MLNCNVIAIDLEKIYFKFAKRKAMAKLFITKQ